MEKIQLAKQVAQKAGRLVTEKFNELHPVKAIDENGIHLEIDFQVEELIKSSILEEFPNHAFLGEENGHNHQQHNYQWIVDPIDGTSNYYFHNPYHCVSIALAEDNEVILGVIYEPYSGKTYWAEKDKGAYVDEKPLIYQPDKIKKIVMGGRTNEFRLKAMKEFVIAQKNYYYKMEMGSAALEIVNVAQGYVGLYLVKGIHLWDVAAANLILTELGGQVLGFDGQPWDGQSDSLLASVDEKLLEEVLAKIK